MDFTEGGVVVMNGAKTSLVSKVKEKQDQDLILLELKATVHKQKVMAFEQEGDSVLRYQGRLCVPRVDELQERIMEIAHSSIYSIHSGSTKMYRNLREIYWWNSMKKGIDEFVAKYLNCQQGVMRFDKKRKLSTPYIRPYRISKRIGTVAYELELPLELVAVHPVFHISILKKCI
ncbi:hypothetical protein MTR67_040093 [Solanum verrucosum]|uniref:Integrase zinc-binding domain-containing protein n=1 Tax=Solanum verrucosum TaxID=315347 RepID=A0AAF0UJS8_SOLVR|nr:hypothetical protein MTR67_040093 [Solanum verrucosum]